MQEGLKKAKEAMKNSYSPYSKFKVGAALLTKDGEYILGTNVENGSYGLTSCAERNALFSAYSKGYKKSDIAKIFIVGDTKNPISPCGACRQVISELMEKNCDVVLSNLKDDIKIFKVKDLIPYLFDLDNA